jgi:hypothetical protein
MLRERPYAERVRMMCEVWAVDGFGTPPAVYTFYVLKIGLYLLGWSVHTLDYLYGRIFFFGGLIIGNAGILYVLLAAYLRLEKSGDL